MIEKNEFEKVISHLVLSLVDTIFVVDKNGTIKFLSPGIERISGYKPEEAIGKNFLDFVHSDDRKELLKVFEKRIKGYEKLHEFRIITKNGGVKYVQSAGRVIFKDGEIAGLVGILRDVTELKEAKGLYKSVAENQDKVGVFILQNGKLRYVSPVIEKITGYSKEELLTMDDPFRLIHPDFADFARLMHTKRERGEDVPELYDLKILTKNGEERWIEMSVTRIMLDGKPAVVGSFIDITDKKKFKEEERRFKLIVENVRDIIAVVSLDSIITYISPSVQTILGFKPEEIVGKSIFDATHKDDIQKSKQSFEEVIRSKRAVTIEIRYLHKNGEYRVMECTRSPVLEDGVVKEVIIVARDVTEKKEMLKKLKKSEEKFRYLYENANDIFYIHDLDGNLISANKTALEVFGYKKEELKSLNIKDLIDENYLEVAFSKIKEKTETKQPSDSYELLCKKKNGEPLWVEIRSSPIIENDKIVAIQGIVRDITQRKMLEKKLEEYKRFFDRAKDLFFVVDTKGRFIDLNPRYAEMLGYTKEELIGKTARALAHPEDLEMLRKYFFKAVNGEVIRFEGRAVAKDGRIFHVEFVEWPVFKNGEVVAVEGIIRDITEKKRIEEKLKESEEMFRSLSEKSLVGIYLIQDGVFKYVNPKFAELWGYSVDELIGRSPLDFIHPDDRDKVDRNLRLRIEGKVDAINYRLRMVRKDGKVRINEVFGSRTTYKGKPAVIGTLIDVTEEEEHRKKLEEYKRFYENAQDLFFILDSRGRFVDVNPKYAEMLGYTKEELLNHTARKLMDPKEVEMVRENFKRVMNGETVRYEAKAIAKDGMEYIMEVTLWPVYDNNKVVGAEGILRDVTEKKIMLEELRKSEAKYRLIVENSRDIIVTVDTKGKRTYVSPAVEKILGYKAEDLIGKSVFEFVHPDDVEDVKNTFFTCLKERKPGVARHRYLRKDGKWIWMESIGSPVVINNVVQGAVIVVRDITERIEMDRKIRESEEKFRKIFENSPSSVAIVDENAVFVDANPTFVKDVGYNPVGKEVHNVFPADVAEKRVECIKQAILNNSIITLEDRIGNRYFLSHFVPIELHNKKHCVVIIRDLTDLIRLNRLLNAVNSINKLILHTLDKNELLRRVCIELATLEDYLSVWIGLAKRKYIHEIASIGIKIGKIEIDDDSQPCKVVRSALNLKKHLIVRRDQNCADCPLAKHYKYEFCIAFPMIYEDVEGVILLYSDVLPTQREIEILQTLANDIAFAIEAINLNEVKRRAYEQIEKNIEQFAYLADRIRNPLAVISGYLEVAEVKDVKENLANQIERIVKILDELDEEWIKTERLRRRIF